MVEGLAGPGVQDRFGGDVYDLKNLTIFIPGTLAASDAVYDGFKFGRPVRLLKAFGHLGTLPTGAGTPVTVELNKAATALDTFNIASSATNSTGSVDLDTDTDARFDSDDVFSVDINAIGSGTAGADLTLIVQYIELPTV